MHTIRVRNVNEALYRGLHFIKRGIHEGYVATCDSRNGPVYRVDEPVTTTYYLPTERVLFSPDRDANPFFHLMESIWMLAGRNDVDFVSRFVGRMKTFSDNEKIFHGAYGYRWRKWFGFDQIHWAINELIKDPKNRRIVISMWSPVGDAIPSCDLSDPLIDKEIGGQSSKDLPCNLMIKFAIVRGKLDMIVFNRSNDMIWGAYGANAVHMSFLQEFVAMGVGIPVGLYHQISSDFHAYQSTFDPLMIKDPVYLEYLDPYVVETVKPYPIVTGEITVKHFEEDIATFFEAVDGSGTYEYSTPFFKEVIHPMMLSHVSYKDKDYDSAFDQCSNIKASDWRMACHQWLERRKK